MKIQASQGRRSKETQSICFDTSGYLAKYSSQQHKRRTSLVFRWHLVHPTTLNPIGYAKSDTAFIDFRQDTPYSLEFLVLILSLASHFYLGPISVFSGFPCPSIHSPAVPIRWHLHVSPRKRHHPSRTPTMAQ
ncbi:hypothetical protein NUU61_005185 [Penicillium alfredii]|uniref:Uncharacterized protein n=1 Tax=Penicillium alfredii TaxID=1506179 RepID=A0A9W9F933_9EURO|nr:uncharacterized protein NUU61_005185 [Penicillium alfredii]KAJ5095829.1 hypothetical protein NUU61_005185 [Penicillium alfredii]